MTQRATVLAFLAAHPTERFTAVEVREHLNLKNAAQILLALAQQRKIDVVHQERTHHKHLANHYQIRQTEKIASMRGVRGVIEHRLSGDER
jgi:hypothetical protein